MDRARLDPETLFEHLSIMAPQESQCPLIYTARTINSQRQTLTVSLSHQVMFLEAQNSRQPPLRTWQLQGEMGRKQVSMLGLTLIPHLL